MPCITFEIKVGIIDFRVSGLGLVEFRVEGLSLFPQVSKSGYSCVKGLPGLGFRA